MSNLFKKRKQASEEYQEARANQILDLTEPSAEFRPPPSPPSTAQHHRPQQQSSSARTSRQQRPQSTSNGPSKNNTRQGGRLGNREVSAQVPSKRSYKQNRRNTEEVQAMTSAILALTQPSFEFSLPEQQEQSTTTRPYTQNQTKRSQSVNSMIASSSSRGQAPNASSARSSSTPVVGLSPSQRSNSNQRTQVSPPRKKLNIHTENKSPAKSPIRRSVGPNHFTAMPIGSAELLLEEEIVFDSRQPTQQSPLKTEKRPAVNATSSDRVTLRPQDGSRNGQQPRIDQREQSSGRVAEKAPPPAATRTQRRQPTDRSDRSVSAQSRDETQRSSKRNMNGPPVRKQKSSDGQLPSRPDGHPQRPSATERSLDDSVRSASTSRSRKGPNIQAPEKRQSERLSRGFSQPCAVSVSGAGKNAEDSKKAKEAKSDAEPSAAETARLGNIAASNPAEDDRDLEAAQPQQVSSSSAPPSPTVLKPGAISITGVDGSSGAGVHGSSDSLMDAEVRPTSAVERLESGPSSATVPAPTQLAEAITTAYAVSNDELESEIRQRIMQEAVQATVQTAEPVDSERDATKEKSWRSKQRLFAIILAIVCCIALILGLVLGLLLRPPDNTDGPSSNDMRDYEKPPIVGWNKDSVVQRGGNVEEVKNALVAQGGMLGIADKLADPNSYQSQAFDFMMNGLSVAVYAERSLAEPFVLLNLYFATGGGWSWLRTDGWLTDVDLCDWHGVQCEDGTAVTGLVLPTNNLTGIIPSEIALLKNQLTTIDLSENRVAGTLPAEMGTLTALKHLDLAGNRLQWIISVETKGMGADLESLNLSRNDFRGGFEGGYWDVFRSLTSLDLSHNNFKSDLGGDVASMASLQYLNVYANRFTGAVPAGIDAMTELRFARFDANFFGGQVSSDVCDRFRRGLIDELVVDCDSVNCTCCTCGDPAPPPDPRFDGPPGAGAGTPPNANGGDRPANVNGSPVEDLPIGGPADDSTGPIGELPLPGSSDGGEGLPNGGGPGGSDVPGPSGGDGPNGGSGGPPNDGPGGSGVPPHEGGPPPGSGSGEGRPGPPNGGPGGGGIPPRPPPEAGPDGNGPGEPP